MARTAHLLVPLAVVLASGRSARAGDDVAGDTIDLSAGQQTVVKTGSFEGMAVDEPTIVAVTPAGDDQVRIVGRKGGRAIVHVFLPGGLRTYVVRVEAVDPRPRRRRHVAPSHQNGRFGGEYRVTGTQAVGRGAGMPELQHAGWFSAPVADGILRFAAEASHDLERGRLQRTQLAYRRGPYEGRLGDSVQSLGSLGPRRSLELRGLEAELAAKNDTLVTAFGGTVADRHRYFALSPTNVFGVRAEGKLDRQQIEWQGRTLFLDLGGGDRPMRMGDQAFAAGQMRMKRPWGVIEAETALMSMGGGGRARLVHQRPNTHTEVGAEWVEGTYLDITRPEDRMGRRHAYLRGSHDGSGGVWRSQLALGVGRESFDTAAEDSRADFVYGALGTSHRTRSWLQSHASGQVTLSRATLGDRQPLDLAAYSASAGAVARDDRRELSLDGVGGVTKMDREDRVTAGVRLRGEQTFRDDDQHLRLGFQLDYNHLSVVAREAPEVPAENGIRFMARLERSLGKIHGLGGAGMGYAGTLGGQAFADGRVAYEPRPQDRIEAGLAVTFDARSGTQGSVMFSYTHRFGLAAQTEQPPFELYAEGEISGRVFIDDNRNGQFDEGEEPLAGVIVRLGGANEERRTDAEGKYRFATVKAGAHLIEIDGKTVPARTRFTTPSPAYVTVGEERQVPADFGVSSAGELVGRIVSDIDGDGQAGINEPGVGGVHLALEGGPATVFAQTNSYGYYRFEGLDPGAYRVIVDPGTMPSGFEIAGDGEGAAEVSALDLARIDFLALALRAVAGVAYQDRNWNGKRDPDEPGAASVSVFCGLAVGISDAQGRYLCRGLAPGPIAVTAFPAPGARVGDPGQQMLTIPSGPTFVDKIDFPIQPTYEAVQQAPFAFDPRTATLRHPSRTAARIAALAAEVPATLALELVVEAPLRTSERVAHEALARARALLARQGVPAARVKTAPARIGIGGKTGRIVVRVVRGDGAP